MRNFGHWMALAVAAMATAWGSSESRARNKAAFFSGTGVMNFLGDGLGTMLLFR